HTRSKRDWSSDVCSSDLYFRSPVEGTTLELSGEAVDAFHGTVSWIRTDEGDDILVAVSHGMTLGARPCQGSYGERVGQGRCCGKIGRASCRGGGGTARVG